MAGILRRKCCCGGPCATDCSSCAASVIINFGGQEIIHNTQPGICNFTVPQTADTITRIGTSCQYTNFNTQSFPDPDCLGTIFVFPFHNCVNLVPGIGTWFVNINITFGSPGTPFFTFNFTKSFGGPCSNLGTYTHFSTTCQGLQCPFWHAGNVGTVEIVPV